MARLYRHHVLKEQPGAESVQLQGIQPADPHQEEEARKEEFVGAR